MRFILLLAAAAGLVFGQGNPDWHREFPAFKIAGNIYYVGTADLAVYLIHTTDGEILINADFVEDVPLIRKSIESLGFKYKDIKVLLISHAHADHDGGIGVIQKDTHAKLMVMQGDAAAEHRSDKDHPAAHVDRVLKDNDFVLMGGAHLTARYTPGHTPGCTTWIVRYQEGGKTVNAVIVGSPNVNPGYILVGNKKYPDIADDYERGFATLKGIPADVFLGAHGAYFGLKEKYAKLKPGGPNPFIDPAGYKAYVAEREQAFRKELQRQKQNPGSPAK